MNDFLYCHHLDNVAPNATVTASAEDAAYPATNLNDRNPGTPSYLTTDTGWWLFDFGAAQRVDLVAFWRHNFDPGLTVQIQANNSDSWDGSPGPALSTTIEIPALPEDEYPFNPFVDLREVEGYQEAGYRYWRINIPNTNTLPCGIGDVWLAAAVRQLDYLRAPAEYDEDHPIVEHKTEFKISLIYDRGVRIRACKAEGQSSSAGGASLQSWYRACRGRARAGLLFPHAEVNDAWFMRFPEGGMVVHDFGEETPGGLVTFAFKAEEIAAGLPL